MNRRGFLGSLVGAVAAGILPSPKVMTRVAKHVAPETGMSIRMIRMFDGGVSRIDVLYGFSRVKPDLAVRIQA